MILLRPYQSAVKSGIYADWNSGVSNVLAVVPTGGGKSVIVSDIVLDGAQQGMQQGIIAHRNELVSQMSMHIARRGIPHRIIGADATVAQITRLHREHFKESFVNHTARTAVIGVDTLLARKDDLQSWAVQTNRWIGDEGHHFLLENKWGRAIKMFPHAQGLGVTATPQRADGKGLGREFDGPFDTMVIGPSTRKLIDMGNLSEYVMVCPDSDLKMDDSDIGETGDFAPKRLKQAARGSHIVGDVVENYFKYVPGKRAICFATDVETGHDIANKFNAFCIRATCLSAKTPFAVREKFLREFAQGTLFVLINVDLFDEGFDVPACEAVILARPTASLVKYLQMVGRGLRPFEGKPYAIIIDHVGNWKRHKLPDMPRAWSLGRAEKRSKKIPDPNDIDLTVCKTCTRPYERALVACPHCGAVPPLPAPRDRSVPMVDGDLIMLDVEMLNKMRADTLIESAGSMGARVKEVAGNIAAKGSMNRQTEKIAAQKRLSDAIAQWAAIERAKHKPDGESYRRFYLATGMDVLSALHKDRTRQEFEDMATLIEGWYL